MKGSSASQSRPVSSAGGVVRQSRLMTSRCWAQQPAAQVRRECVSCQLLPYWPCFNARASSRSVSPPEAAKTVQLGRTFVLFEDNMPSTWSGAEAQMEAGSDPASLAISVNSSDAFTALEDGERDYCEFVAQRLWWLPEVLFSFQLHGTRSTMDQLDIPR